MSHPTRATVAVAILLCCVAATAPAETEPQPIRLASSSWVGNMPTNVAHALQLFDATGNRPAIRIDEYDSGQRALQSLIEGESEFALAAAPPVARALLDAAAGRGPDIAVLAGVSLSNLAHVVIADGSAGIQRPSDLTGRRVGLIRGNPGHFSWQQFIHHHGIAEDTVTLIDVPIERQLDALLAGNVHAVASWEPWSTRLRDRLGDRARVFTTRYLYTVSWLLVTRESVLIDHPGAAERILAGYAGAMAVMDRNLPLALTLYADSIGIDVAEVAPQADGMIWGLRLDWSVAADLETQLSRLTGSAAPPASMPLPADYLQAAPLRAVHPRGVTLPDYFYSQRPALP